MNLIQFFAAEHINKVMKRRKIYSYMDVADEGAYQTEDFERQKIQTDTER